MYTYITCVWSWFRSPSFVWFWTVTSSVTWRKSIYNMWDNPIHGWDVYVYSHKMCIIIIYCQITVCVLKLPLLHLSPSCVLLPLDSVDPVMNSVHLRYSLHATALASLTKALPPKTFIFLGSFVLQFLMHAFVIFPLYFLSSVDESNTMYIVFLSFISCLFLSSSWSSKWGSIQPCCWLVVSWYYVVLTGDRRGEYLHI